MLLFTLILVGFATIQGFSQADSLSDVERLEVVNKYEPQLENAVKLNPVPEMKEPERSAASFSYNIPDANYGVKPVYRLIDPVFLKTRQNPEVYGNFIKAGIGNYFTPYLKAFLHDHSDKKYDYGLMYEHLSSNANTPNKTADFSDNEIRIFGNKTKGSTKLSGDLNYNRRVFHYYAFDTTNDFTNKDVNQILNTFDASVGYKRKLNKNLKLTTGAAYYHWSSLTKGEDDFVGELGLSAAIGKGDLDLDFAANFTSLKNETEQYNRVFIDVDPSYTFKMKKFHFDVGFNSTYFVDTVASTSQFYIMPDLGFYTYIVPEKLRAFASLTGNFQKNKFENVFTQNQFVGEFEEMRNTFTPIDFTLGIKGQVQSKLDYGISINTKTVKDLMLFAQDTTDLRRFTVIYDDASIFTLHGEFKVNLKQKVSFGAKGNWYSYNLDNEKQAWQLPNYDLTLFTQFNVVDKLFIEAKLYSMGERFGTVVNSGVQQGLSPFFDLNLSADYRYKDNISFFVNVNNITGGRYQMWYNYPVYGLNAIAGFTVTL